MAPVLDLFVDPLGGNDANPGTQQKPLKTLKQSLSLAMSGQTVHLFPGTYDAQNGEDFVGAVPAGVSIAAVVPGDAVLVGQNNGVALYFAGDGSASYLRIQGFSTGIQADTGVLSLTEIDFQKNSEAISLSGNAQASLKGGSIADGRSAFRLDGVASLAISTTEIHNLGPNCNGDVGVLWDASYLTLEEVKIYDVAGSLALRHASFASIKNSVIKSVGDHGCGGSNTIYATEAAQLHLEDTTISEPPGTPLGISGSASVKIVGGAIASSGNAINIYEVADVTIDELVLTGPGAMVNTAAILITAPGAHVTATNATILSFLSGIELWHGSVKLRDSVIKDCNTGAYVMGGNLDLGSAEDPGGNTLQIKLGTALALQTSAITVKAAGNTWIPSTQGANAAGLYPSGTLMGPLGTNAPAPRNFYISAAGSTILL
jgi:predicted RecA/RadA family phage recombinase